MTTKKLILSSAAVIVVAVLAAVLYLSSNLDSLIKSAIEKYGSQITGAAITVSGVDISPSTGAGTIRGLRVGNPPGFSGAPAFELDQISVRINVASLTGSPVVIEEILIAGTRVNVVTNSSGGTNIEAINRNANSHSGGSTADSKPAETPEPADSSPAPLLRIAKFTFEQGAVSADLSQAGGKQYNTELPELRLNNLGGTAGATPTEIGKEITDAVTDAVSRVVARRGVDELIDRNLDGREAEAAKGLLKGLLK